MPLCIERETEMSNLKLPAMDYANLRKLTGLRGTWTKIAYQTWVRMADDATVEVKHHDSIIARVSLTKTVIDNHGYHTVTTANRLNRIVYANTGMYVCIHQREMKVRYSGTNTMRPVNGEVTLYNKG